MGILLRLCALVVGSLRLSCLHALVDLEQRFKGEVEFLLVDLREVEGFLLWLCRVFVGWLCWRTGAQEERWRILPLLKSLADLVLLLRLKVGDPVLHHALHWLDGKALTAVQLELDTALRLGAQELESILLPGRYQKFSFLQRSSHHSSKATWSSSCRVNGITWRFAVYSPRSFAAK